MFIYHFYLSLFLSPFQIQDGLAQQRQYLLVESEKFASLLTQSITSSDDKKNEKFTELFDFLYEQAHINYGEGLYNELAGRKLFKSSKIKKKFKERKKYLRKRFLDFKKQLLKDSDSSPVCAINSISYFLGYRREASQNLIEELKNRPGDRQVAGLLNIYGRARAIEIETVKSLINEIETGSSDKEPETLLIQFYYVTMNWSNEEIDLLKGTRFPEKDFYSELLKKVKARYANIKIKEEKKFVN